ncbi:long-chain-fatty-acid--AMP ligase FadD28 domain protein [Mycobacterium kansasii]|uniref:Long-chain-fatty-acid--AMP ligase FadD28 domain protein n=1 Tax=Mycobacterium kansasii TaxID=1768 RepID=A0A1V3XU03_MYCKA|nr:long-chain-fatty-acid--AMP ligase FadD28 domain protein [Mycobacterium kansasii]
MAENRRLGFCQGRRIVHHRPDQRPADRLRAQPLSDDIEATIQEITRGRCAAISVPSDRSTEKLVAIIELRKRGDSDPDAMERLGAIKREVTSALSASHGLSVADLVLVAPGSIPITTSGKVRRAACVEQYRHDQFARLDV